jgi:hypothetical protein
MPISCRFKTIYSIATSDLNIGGCVFFENFWLFGKKMVSLQPILQLQMKELKENGKL